METHHGREAVLGVKQQQQHVLAAACRAEDAAAVSEQAYEKFVRENADRKQKLQDTERIAAATDLLQKHIKVHTEKDELLLQLQVRPLPPPPMQRCAAHAAAGDGGRRRREAQGAARRARLAAHGAAPRGGPREPSHVRAVVLCCVLACVWA